MNLSPIAVKRAAISAAAFGSFLPWVDVGSSNLGGRSFTQGSLVTVAALVALFVSFHPPRDPKARTFDAVLAVASLGACVWFYLDTFRGERRIGSPGYGLFLCLVGSVVWLAWIAWDNRSTTRYRRRRPPRRLDDWG